MKRASWLRITPLTLGVLAICVRTTNAAPLPRRNEIDEGKRVFAMSCSVGYCHGSEGSAGKGPRLRGRVWSRSYLYNTIQKGIPNSSMPSWQGRLDDKSINDVVAYILSIAQEQPDAEPSQVDKESDPSNRRPDKQAELGKALFFDPMKDRNCGVCHRFAGSGTAVATAFNGLARRTDQDLLRQILDSPEDSPGLQVLTTEGESICGIKAGETGSSLRIYDLATSGPPVLRTLDSVSIRNTAPCARSNVHEKNSRSFSKQELLKIVAFLKTFSDASAR